MTATTRCQKLRGTLFVAMFIGATVFGAAAQPAGSPEDALVDAMVWGVDNLDISAYAPEVKAELAEALRRSQAYRSARPRPAGSPELAMKYAAQVRQERLLVAFASDAVAQALAVEYVDRLRPCYEWEGYHDCPEREASFAAAYLAAHADGPFKEYLPLLAAHRWLCTAEAYDYEQRPEDAARSRRAYEAAISIAGRSRSLLVHTATAALVARGRCRS